MNVEQYFGQADTPSANSPVAVMMLRVLEKYPNLTLDQARTEAKQLLDRAAKGRSYRLPHVYTEQEKAARAERLRNVFRPVKLAA